MEREDAKDLALSILVIAVVALVMDCVWLHAKNSRLARTVAEQGAALAIVTERLERHVNPPAEPGLGEKAKGAYNEAREATVRQYEKVKAAASAGYRAVKRKLDGGVSPQDGKDAL